MRSTRNGSPSDPRASDDMLVFFFLTWWDVSENSGVFPPKSSILRGFSIINHENFGVALFLETPMCEQKGSQSSVQIPNETENRDQ